MSRTTCLRLGLACCILWLGAVPGSAAGPARPAGKKGKKEVAMVDALANRNTPPKLVDVGVRRLAQFPDKYDWKEQGRVESALWKITEEPTEELWEELVRRAHDQRYCLTIKDQNESFAQGNQEVGFFCNWLARDWLRAAYAQHLPGDPFHAGFRIYVDIGLGADLKKWREKRAGKQLYELQIEVCEETIRQLAKAAKVSQKEKDRATNKIKREIVTLKRTKRPIFTDHSGGHWVTFRPKDLDGIRRALRRIKK